MKKILGIIGIALGAVLVLGAAGFFYWALTPSLPGEKALAYLVPDETVDVSVKSDYIAFTPIRTSPETGFIFYPGGHVDYRAYSPILRMIAERGFLVILVNVNLNLAIFDIESGAVVFGDYPQIKKWIAGGHSLGGATSVLFASNHPEIKGIVFWASYPPDDRLRDSLIRFISIYGTEDGGLDDGRKIAEKKPLMPEGSEFVVIDGGNHAQFGDYGPQPGDNEATIPAGVQWLLTVDATTRFLRSF